jgi:hypothetical protein
VSDNSPVVVNIDFEKAVSLPIEEVRDMISQLEELLKNAPQIEIPCDHYFSKGVYGREIKVTKGSLLVGKIHKHSTMNVLSAGEVSVLSQDGVMRFTAPHTFVSTPGAKRVIYAHADSVWTCFHGTHETDVEKIEEEFIAKSYDEVVALEPAKQAIELEGAVCLG